MPTGKANGKSEGAADALYYRTDERGRSFLIPAG